MPSASVSFAARGQRPPQSNGRDASFGEIANPFRSDRVITALSASIQSFDARRAVARRRWIDLVVGRARLCRADGRKIQWLRRASPYRGAPLAAKIDMLQFDAANLIGGFIFGSIGFVAFIYGKRMQLWKMMLCGLALMVFPYFVENMSILYSVGIAGTVALFFLRD